MPRDVHDLNNKEKIPSKGRIVQLLDPIIGPPGIPVREFPGIWHCQITGGNYIPGILRKLRSVIFSLLFHYLSSFITI